MNLSKLAPLTVALLCITAIGVSATTLESSLSTDPDEAVDTYEVLPIGQEDAAALQQEFEGDADRADGGADGNEPESGDSESDQRSATGGDSDESAASQEQGLGMGPSEPSLLDRILEFLLSILRFLLALVTIVGLAAIAYRYRERIVAALEGLFGQTDDGASQEAEGRSWPHGEPSNAVERAWLALVRTVDPDRPSVMTPSECAEAARRAGLDAAPVETITRAFERVEYGGVPPSAEADRVEAAMLELDQDTVQDGGRGRGQVRGDGGTSADDPGGGDPGDRTGGLASDRGGDR
jgi:hypothetical protein